jgi:hypothetical protein
MDYQVVGDDLVTKGDDFIAYVNFAIGHTEYIK